MSATTKMCVSDKSGIIANCSATYHLKMGATKISSRDTKRWKLIFSGYFSKAKIEECNQTN